MLSRSHPPRKAGVPSGPALRSGIRFCTHKACCPDRTLIQG
jgi:hypothetical protein